MPPAGRPALSSKFEKYAGDLRQKKTITPDYLTHLKKSNHGEEAFITIRNHHLPIIERNLWEQTQAELARRARRPSLSVWHV